jgi:hypothetical protein
MMQQVIMKYFLDKSKQWFALFGFGFLFFCTVLFTPAHVHASNEQINAGMLSEVWFSTLRIEDGNTIGLYGLFQNTSGKTIEADVDIFVDDEKIATDHIRVEHDAVARIDTDWKASVGTYDVRMVAVKVVRDGETVSPDTLLETEAKATIKINQKITPEYIRTLTSKTYKSTVSTVDSFVADANKKLDAIKAPLAPAPTSEALIEQVVVIDGRVTSDTSTATDVSTDQSAQAESVDKQENSGVIDQEGANAATGQVLGMSYSNNEAVMQALKDKPFDVVLYYLISALQWLLVHWQLTLGVVLVIIALLLGKRFLHA